MSRNRQIEVGALRGLFQRMGPHLKAHRRKLILGFLAMIGVALAEIMRPWPIKVVFDGLLVPQENPDAVTGWLLSVFGNGNVLLGAMAATILGIALLSGAMGFAQAYLIAAVGQKVVAAIRLDLYRHIHRLSHSFHDTTSSGDIITRLTGDVRMMRDLLIDAVVFFAARILVIVLTIGVMLWMDWRLTLVALTILPALWFITRYFGKRIKGAARKQRRKEGKIAVVMTEGISAINVVKGFARESYEEARFAKQNNSSAEAGVVTTRLAANMDRVTQVLLALGTAVVIWFGVTQVRAGAISPGDLLVFTAYLSSLYKPIRKMASMTARVAKATASGERLLEIFDLEPDIAEHPDAKPIQNPIHGWILFDEVSFSYAGTKDAVLDRVELELHPGEVTALVGPSGAGKSTLARLLMRFYDPTEGAVRIDGQDIRNVTLDSLRGNIAVVLQDSVLFGTSVRDNIAYGRLDATDEEIVAAAEAAEADAFIRNLPDGYETVLGERGETLSGGQRQRIAIARAILRDAPILILDEPLTGLDPATAKGLLGGLRRAAAGRTTLLVAHDELTLSLADHVIRVDQGGLSHVVKSKQSLSA